jgi:hypothetical protein
LRAPEKRSRSLRLLGGLVVWITTLYCGPLARRGRGRGAPGSGLYPELAAFGIRDGCSPALISRVGRQTALLPSYDIARDELAQAGTPLNVKVVHRLGRQLGAEVLTTRTRDLLRYRAGQLPAGTTLAGKRVGAAIDGGRIRIRTVIRKQKGRGRHKRQRRRFRVEWREPKLLILFELDVQGKMRAGSRPWIDGTFGGPDEVMELLALHLHRLGAAQAELVVFVADGAPWIWERLEWVRQRVGVKPSRCVRVLDWYHAVHHVSLLLQALGLETAERQRHFQQVRKRLRAGRARQIIAELAALAGTRVNDDDVRRELVYLETHTYAGHMDYAAFRRRGVPLGSGAIESAVRRVVNLRLKGNGITWYEENAEALLVLRAVALSRRWQETLEHVQAIMASDRRLDWSWQSPDMPAELKAGLDIQPPKSQDQTQQAPSEVAA